MCVHGAAACNANVMCVTGAHKRMVLACGWCTDVCEVFMCSCVFCGHVFVEPMCCIWGMCVGGCVLYSCAT